MIAAPSDSRGRTAAASRTLCVSTLNPAVDHIVSTPNLQIEPRALSEVGGPRLIAEAVAGTCESKNHRTDHKARSQNNSRIDTETTNFGFPDGKDQTRPISFRKASSLGAEGLGLGDDDDNVKLYFNMKR